MVQAIAIADPRSLVAPLLAFLSVAFATKSPPPSLLPLLSPILRQRVQLLSATATTKSESWLPLLCWNPAQALRLPGVVEDNSFEPHPVSGEVELGEVTEVQYRRVDEETFHSRIRLADLGVAVIYSWCEGDQEGGGTGWRVSEIQPLSSLSDSDDSNRFWHDTILEADEEAGRNLLEHPLESGTAPGILLWSSTSKHREEDKADDDDDYWAQYDNTPARTPAMKSSPGPDYNGGSTQDNMIATSDAEYYAQYAQVQPAMENHDPSEGSENTRQSTLNGNAIFDAMTTSKVQGSQWPQEIANGNHVSDEIVHTRPSSSSSSTSAVARLEDSAATQSHGEIAVQQHISTSIKSLFRLARGIGMEKEEFDRLVTNELSALSMMMEDD
ncbi:hypothetical protein MMC34_007915 [Xylographa carneopallida]|nr:hypothetical protein [Xylographa carneopallida]